MTVLVAPDAFKGTFSAAVVAAAIGRGVERAGRGARLLPLADGGEGTASVLLTALGGSTGGALVRDPLGRPRRAGFVLLEDGGTAVVEVAEAGGLPLVGMPTPSTAWAASTYGTGELIAAAAATGASVVIVAAGGSASTDGGAGALEALTEVGWAQPSVTKGSDPFVTPRVVVLCDVEVVWEECARVFGPQKGADDDTVRALEARLDALAATLPRDPRGVARTGAAGGLSGGLWAGADAVLEPGAAWVADALELDEALADASAVVVGEGALDATSARGKVVGEVCARAKAAGVPAYAVVGRDDSDAPLRAQLALAGVLQASTLTELESAGEQIARAGA